MRITEFFKRLFRSERVLFADLDGTLIVTKSGETFPKNCTDWVFKEGMLAALVKYKPNYLFIVSNQGGIELGHITETDFRAKMRNIISVLQEYLPKTRIEYAFCPTNKKEDEYRKPNTGMLEYFYHDYINGNDFDKKNAVMIGNASGLDSSFSNSDYECANRFGIRYLDVNYFIRWGDPCRFCPTSGMRCKYITQSACNIDSFPCDEDKSFDGWCEEYRNDVNAAVLKRLEGKAPWNNTERQSVTSLKA